MIRSLFLIVLAALDLSAADKWVTVWTGSTHGPYPAGNAVAQPDLKGVLAPAGAADQTFRLVIRPDIWSGRMRLRCSNVFGSQPVSFDGVYLGIHAGGGAIVPRTNRPVRFNGKPSVTIEPGQLVWSDPVDLSYVKNAADPMLSGRKLAVSFHVAGSSGPITWHAKSLQTSYLSAPRTGAHGGEESADAFPFTTTSWYFLDAVDAMEPETVSTVVAFGDSITDGTASTINGDDRWPDFFSRRLHAAYGARFSVVNAGIGGNQIVGPAKYDTAKPPGGGPSALSRLDRDVLQLSGVATVIWLEGINDLGGAGASAETVIAGLREGVERMHAKHIKVIGATVTSALTSTSASGTPEVNARRKAVDDFIRTSGVFDAVADFDAATLDTATGALRAEFQPNSSIGGPGDRLHPNRAGYQAMAGSIDLKFFAK